MRVSGEFKKGGGVTPTPPTPVACVSYLCVGVCYRDWGVGGLLLYCPVGGFKKAYSVARSFTGLKLYD